jgi:hypothetical protein
MRLSSDACVQDMWTNPIVTLGGRAPRAMHRRLSQRSQDSSLTEAQSSSSRKGGDADAEGDEIEMQARHRADIPKPSCFFL